MSTPAGLLAGLVDDAAMFPPGNAPLPDAVRAHGAHRASAHAWLVGSFVVSDRTLPKLAGLLGEASSPLAISLVVTGGAGAIAPALGLAAAERLDVRTLEVALRDPDALAGNAARVTTVLDLDLPDGALAYIEMPRLAEPAQPSTSWLEAADVVAQSGHRLKFRTGGESPEAHPLAGELAACIDAGLDRELEFKCTAGLHHAVRHTSEEGFEQHGFLNVLVATRALLDGASAEDAAVLLEQRNGATLVAALDELDQTAWVKARCWFTSFGSCSISDPVADLTELGLIEPD